MVIAQISSGALVLGLEPGNIERLQQGKPIRVTQESHGVELPESMPAIYIMYGMSQQAIVDELNAAQAGTQ